ncbi:Putative upf0442 protein [Acrodontium crateriforme]|uniref:Upf0442 protein n=1 Tax=Acrodontium crateriforme TaxID=150365 RepID=A0AAQ3M0M7_9PEZI|nr:Putative upf0442 protein [Acrodontium crateriforme]
MSNNGDDSPTFGPVTEPPNESKSTTLAVTAGQDGSSVRRKEKKRVGFNNSPTVDERKLPKSPTLRPAQSSDSPGTPPLSPYDLMYTSPQPPPAIHHARSHSGGSTVSEKAFPSPQMAGMSEQHADDIRGFALKLPAPKQRSAIRRTSHTAATEQDDTDTPDEDGRKIIRKAKEKEAFERAKRLERNEQARKEHERLEREREEENMTSEPASSRTSLDDSMWRHESSSARNFDANLKQDIANELEKVLSNSDRKAFTQQAHCLVQNHLGPQSRFRTGLPSHGLDSGLTTPTEGQGFIEDYKPPPEQYRGGILSSLLKLYNQPQGSHHSRRSHSRERSSSRQRWSNKRSSSHDRPSSRQRMSRASGRDYFNFKPSADGSPDESAPVTPGTPTTPTSGSHFFHKKSKHKSSSSLVQLIGSSTSLGLPSVTSLGEYSVQKQKQQEKLHRGRKHHSPGGVINRFGKSRAEEEIRITVHIAEIIQRQRYLLKLCRALMLYGAPTHRLEEYMNMSARVLEIQAQFLYIPGSMIISFDDVSTHTADVKLVRLNQGLDLGKLRDTHEVYKDVVHDVTGVEEATARLKEIAEKPEKHARWLRIILSGIACATVGPFSFGARPIDIPICFLLGTLLAFLQLVVTPQSNVYANVFEVTACIIASFLSRAIGSIRGSDGNYIFCFAALVQSSICLILPGYAILCSALELQSKSIIAGSVRLIYSIIYALFLGYGITIGSIIYGVMDQDATSETVCSNQMSAPYTFPFVIVFTLCMVMLYQAKWRQAPTQLFIAFVGYIVNYYSSLRFKDNNTQISSTFAALAIGVLANLYSRIGARWENTALDIWEDRLRPRWKALRGKARVKIPSIVLRDLESGMKSPDSNESEFVRKGRRVGYGLAAAAMLPAIFVQVPGGLAVSGGLIAGIASADQIAHNKNMTMSVGTQLNAGAFTVAYSVIEIAVGLTVGLFLAALFIYPLGKRRSGLFSF